MEKKLFRFFLKHQLKPTHIAYIFKENRHTTVKLKSGEQLKTTIPMKYFLSVLPEGAYLNITKGVIVASSEIEKIEGNIYTMRDGRIFTGRVRSAGEHKANRKILENHPQINNRLIFETVFHQFSIMDQLPLPFSVIELIFDTENRNIDFIVRYCNEAMAKHQGFLREEVLDQPYERLSQSSNKKWALIYTEVALTGIAQSVQDIDPKTGIPFTVHCFQPAKNLCACIIT